MIALQSLISIGLLVWIVGLYNSYRVDRLRHRLFAIRDKLFDEARAGNIAFDSRGYRAARDMCNGLIRFGHKISWLEFLAFRSMASRQAYETAAQEIADFKESLAPEERTLTNRYMEMANREVLTHLILSPYVLFSVVLPLGICIAAKSGVDLIAIAIRRMSGPLQSLDALAIKEGRQSGRRDARRSVFA